jgi:hypothetical protein
VSSGAPDGEPAQVSGLETGLKHLYHTLQKFNINAECSLKNHHKQNGERAVGEELTRGTGQITSFCREEN